MIILDLIEANADPNDPVHAAVCDWTRRVRELQRRQDELLEKSLSLIDADDLDGFDATASEFDKVSAELDDVNRRHKEMLSRLRKSVETMQ